MNCPKCGGYAVEATSLDLPYDFMCSVIGCGFQWKACSFELDRVTVESVIGAVKALSVGLLDKYVHLGNAELVMAPILRDRIARIGGTGRPLAPEILIEQPTLFGFPIYTDAKLSPDVIEIRAPRVSVRRA